MRILVSNDDGMDSPGIAALAEVAADFGEIRIVAPDGTVSGEPLHHFAPHRPRFRPTTRRPSVDDDFSSARWLSLVTLVLIAAWVVAARSAGHGYPGATRTERRPGRRAA